MTRWMLALLLLAGLAAVLEFTPDPAPDNAGEVRAHDDGGPTPTPSP